MFRGSQLTRVATVAALLALGLACTQEPGPADTRAGDGDTLPAGDQEESVADAPSTAGSAGGQGTAVAPQEIARLLESGNRIADLAEIVIDYPQDESIVPPEFLAPTFLWHDGAEAADAWLLEVSFAGDAEPLHLLVPGWPPPPGEIDPMAISGTNEIYEPTPYQASAHSWKPEPGVWEAIKARSVEEPATVTLLGYRQAEPEHAVSRGRMTLTTSQDPLGAPIFYRDVPLIPSPTGDRIMPIPKDAFPLIAWRIRDISQPASRVVMRDMPTCANCHSFSADGETLGMDLDGPSGDKGAYMFTSIKEQMVIGADEVITWNSFEDKPEGHVTLGFMARVSPDGQTVLATVNEALYIVNFLDFRFGQVFFPTRGIIAYYSRETDDFHTLPGADDPEYVQTDSVWSPDGKTVVFCRGTASDPHIMGRDRARYAGDPNETPMLYDLYRMPFNEGRGGQPEAIAGASNNGMSNSFPKVSPDGKWIVYVQSKNGQLMRPDSKLWIVPFEGGESRLMRCNQSLMNSWHSFSPNGRWMVFSSKGNTPYTQMFLTHIDEDGNDSPALLIENSTAANRAANLPEFVNITYDNLMGITVPAVDYYRHYHRGNKLQAEGRFEDAVVAFGEALQVQTDSRIHNDLAKTLMHLGRNDEALEHVRASLGLNPYNYEVFNNLAFLLSERGGLEEARQHLDTAIKLYPQQPRAWYNRAMLSLKLGNHDAAIEDFGEALKLSPRYSIAYSGRGMVYHELGNQEQALRDFDTAIELRPEEPTAWYFRALIRAEQGNLAGALHDVKRARETAPPGMPQLADIDNLQRHIVSRLEGGTR